MAMYVGLLRGINVGGNNKLPMKNLAALIAELGYGCVKTHLQSGNVIFDSAREIADERIVAASIEVEIERRCGFRPPVILRSQDELRDAVNANPLLTTEMNPSRMIVVFLQERPNEAAIARLEPDRFPNERFTVVGREMFVDYGEGMASSKFLQSYYERRLGTIGTARNWNTVNKVLDLMQA